MTEVGLILARWLHYGAVTTQFGLALFLLYAPRTRLGREPATRRTTAVLAWLALASGVGWLLFSTASMAGDLASTPGALSTVLFETDFGPIWTGRMALALMLCLPPIRHRTRIQMILAGLLLASLALTGHARLHEGAVGWVHGASDAAHLLAAGTWLGALAAFVILLRQAPDDAETARALGDFSTVSSIAVTVLLASGLANTWFVLEAPTLLVTSLYGRLLMLKVGLFALMVALAGANRFRLVPALKAASDSSGVANQLRRHALAELALGAAVLLVVAGLGTLDPAA
ncbi:MAG TPA: copper homeostasis membrane protein CopD [Caulobacteraceae bacterium]